MNTLNATHDPASLLADPSYVQGSNSGGVNFNTTTTDTSTALYAPVQNVMVLAPPADSQAISFAGMFQTVYQGPGNIINGGHSVGLMGWGVNLSSATNAMGIGVEGRYDHVGSGTPTTTRAHGLLGLVVNSQGAMISAYGQRSEFQVAAGATIGSAYGAQVNVTTNGGAIVKLVGFGMANMQGVVTGIGTKYFLENLDTQAPSVLMSPTVQQDYGYGVPTSGQAVQYPNFISDFTVLPDSTLAALTLALPTAPLDGQAVTFSTTQAITVLNLVASSGTVYNAPSSLAAGATIEYKFLGRGINIWVRKR